MIIDLWFPVNRLYETCSICCLIKNTSARRMTVGWEISSTDIHIYTLVNTHTHTIYFIFLLSVHWQNTMFLHLRAGLDWWMLLKWERPDHIGISALKANWATVGGNTGICCPLPQDILNCEYLKPFNLWPGCGWPLKTNASNCEISLKISFLFPN